MAILNREVRAIQNPALGSILIWRAASGYQKTHLTSDFMPLPLAFLVLPILYHEETASLVTTTRTASGLRKLTEKFRSAEESKTDLLLAVGGRATAMRELSWESLRLAFSSNILALDTAKGTLLSLSETPLVSGVPHLGESLVLLVQADEVNVLLADDGTAPLLHANVIVAIVEGAQMWPVDESKLETHFRVAHEVAVLFAVVRDRDRGQTARA